MTFPRLREAIRARAFPPSADASASALARALVVAGGGRVLGIVFFGSRRTGAGFDPWSAYDFFVATRGYLAFYRSLRAAGALARPALLHATLNVLLPPSQLSFRTRDAGGRELLAKCAVISLAALTRETSSRRHDHFCLGRLFQPSEVLFAADAAVAERLLDALVRAQALSYGWARPWLPPRLDAADYGRTILRVSLSGEIRPEPAGRAEALFEAQRGEQEPVHRVLLAELAAAGELVEAPGGRFDLARPTSAAERLRLRAYFAWSKLRATARWLKHVVTFEGWLDYILQKARRHAGEEIVLAPHERRFPLLFLWPRLVRYLREKERRGERR
jgi:hypothetical protein